MRVGGAEEEGEEGKEVGWIGVGFVISKVVVVVVVVGG